MTGLMLAPLFRGRLETSANFDAELQPRVSDVRGGAWAMIAWLAAFVLATALVGFFAALILFFVVFLKAMAEISWQKITVLTLAATGLILTLINALNFVLPSGLLQEFVEMPRPFR
jgi:hypothetical protein